jgi:hypothetical protein
MLAAEKRENEKKGLNILNKFNKGVVEVEKEIDFGENPVPIKGR